MTGGSGLHEGALAPALERLERGTRYKAALEALLLELDEADASRLDLFLRESRGAWLLFARGSGRRALLVGDALSGTALALARLGWEVSLYDSSDERLRYARDRQRDLCGTEPALVLADGAARLPFEDGAFELVVQEGGLPCGVPPLREDAAELWRVASEEVALVADNRLGYKVSTGHRGEFRVPGIREYLERAIDPPRGVRTLAGYRRVLGAGAPTTTEAYALYPTARDFAFVVGCDGRPGGPTLPIGPKERANRPKVWAHRLGLFPWLTSSFALVCRRGGGAGKTRAQRLLAELAERTGEPEPAAEHVIATRGNSAVLLTAVPGADVEDPAGRWAVHVPISPRQELRVRRGFERLGELRQRFPALPCAEPLFAGELEGLHVSCQRRLGGWPGPQVSGDTRRMPRLFRDLAAALATLRVGPARPWSDADTAELLEPKRERVARHAEPPAARREVERLVDEARERLTGLPVPRVAYHGDLRSKHVRVDPRDGALLGVLDWGSSEPADLPYFDLVNWLVHERQHEGGLTGREAWHLVRRGDLRDWEHEALEHYRTTLDLPSDYCRTIEHLFPVLVAAMAEKHWDFSRPRWLQRLYGLGT